MRKIVVAASAVALLLTACSGATPPPRAAAPAVVLPAETLLLGTEAGPIAVRAPSGSLVSSFPGAVVSADGSLVYTTTPDAASTVLETVAGGTGDVASRARIRGDYQVRAVSGSGRSAALLEPLPEGWDPWIPIPRSETTIVVADPSGAEAPRRYVLDGNYEPEAFSTDDRQLFLIEHLPALSPTVYRVTTLDLERGKVLPVFGPFKVPPERMPGTRLQQVPSPAADQLYTLYSSARRGYAPHGATVEQDAVVSFVHVLDLEQGWAHCVGLPEEMWDRPHGAQAMAPSPDGRYLIVVDAGLGLAAVMDTETLQVRRGSIDLASKGEIDRTAARVSPDGETLFLATSGARSVVTAIDVRTFEVRDRWSLDGTVSGLGLSSDGTRLYAALGDRVAVLDPRTGLELGVVVLETPDRVTSVMAIAA